MDQIKPDQRTEPNRCQNLDVTAGRFGINISTLPFDCKTAWSFCIHGTKTGMTPSTAMIPRRSLSFWDDSSHSRATFTKLGLDSRNKQWTKICCSTRNKCVKAFRTSSKQDQPNALLGLATVPYSLKHGANGVTAWTLWSWGHATCFQLPEYMGLPNQNMLVYLHKLHTCIHIIYDIIYDVI